MFDRPERGARRNFRSEGNVEAFRQNVKNDPSVSLRRRWAFPEQH